MTDKRRKETQDRLIGMTVRTLRESKSLLQLDAAGLELTPTFISQMEAGEKRLSLDHLMDILKNIKATMYDFENTYNYLASAEGAPPFSLQVDTAWNAEDSVTLRKLLNELEEEISRKPNKKKLLLDRAELEILVALLDSSYNVPAADSDRLVNYLLKANDWGEREMQMLDHCLEYFDSETQYRLAQRMIEPTQVSLDLRYTHHLFLRILLHIICTFIARHQLSHAESLISYLEKRDISDFFMYEKELLIYARAYLDYERGDRDALATMKESQAIFTFSRCDETAARTQAQIDRIERR